MDSGLLIALRLAKEGFGSPEDILEMRTDTVLAALEYCEFLVDYEITQSEISKDST